MEVGICIGKGYGGEVGCYFGSCKDAGRFRVTVKTVNAEKKNTENAGQKMTQTPEMQRRFPTPEIHTPVSCPLEVQLGEPAGHLL